MPDVVIHPLSFSMGDYIMFTLSTNVMTVKEAAGSRLCTPEDVRTQLADAATMAQEGFFVLTVNTKNKVIDTHMITLGIVDAALVHPREVFRPAISDGAAAVILAHNHPSGDPTPSAEDIRITRQLVEAGRVIDIRVLDHVILGRDQTPFISLREAGIVDFA
jgi:DNA repair protein RadC